MSGQKCFSVLSLQARTQDTGYLCFLVLQHDEPRGRHGGRDSDPATLVGQRPPTYVQFLKLASELNK